MDDENKSHLLRQEQVRLIAIYIHAQIGGLGISEGYATDALNVDRVELRGMVRDWLEAACDAFGIRDGEIANLERQLESCQRAFRDATGVDPAPTY